MCMVYENVYINGIKKSSPHPFEFSVILLKIKQKSLSTLGGIIHITTKFPGKKILIIKV